MPLLKTTPIPVLCALVLSLQACGGPSLPPLTGIGTSAGKSPRAIPGDTRAVLAKGVWRSEVELDWVVQDKGTSYVDRSKSRLWFELAVDENRSFVLRVHWEPQVVGAGGVELGPYSAQRGRSTVQGHAITDSWRGRITEVDRETRLHIDAGRKDLATLEFRCAWVRDDVVDYVHCAPMRAYEDAPSKDPLPSYLRTPLVFVPEGRLMAHIHGDHRGQSVVVATE